MPKSEKWTVNELSEVVKVSGDTVGNVSLEMCPDKLIGIELGSISREMKSSDPGIISEDLFNNLGPVNLASVPKENDGTWEVPSKKSDELSDMSCLDVHVGVKTSAESQTFSFGRNSNGRDSRDLGPAARDNEYGRLSLNRPCSSNIGDEGESALIQEYQAGSKLPGLFLYEARRDISSSEWPLPGAPSLFSSAFDSSSPNCPSVSTSCLYSNVRGSVCGLPVQYASESRGPLSNRLPRDLSPEYVLKISSCEPEKAVEVPDGVWVSGQTVLSCGRLDATEPGNLSKPLLPWLPNRKCGLDSINERPDAVVSRVLAGCHEVS